MLEVKGKYAIAKIFADKIDESALHQIQILCDQSFTQNTKIRIMPDVHAGNGCVIGFTADFYDKVIPQIVGVDIGCGMLCVELGQRDFSFEKIDSLIHQYIPSGFSVHEERLLQYDELQELYCYRDLKHIDRIEKSLGTLGGGNHFIEIDRDEDNNRYLVIHTGSRSLGQQVAQYYSKKAIELREGKNELLVKQQQLIQDYKAQGRQQEIQSAIIQLHQSYRTKNLDIPEELCYLTGEYLKHYLHDMAICQRYAYLNRKMIAEIIVKHLFHEDLDHFLSFETIHNYIDLNHRIIRKGAVSAMKNEKLLIPLNMRDGSFICIGKGNEEWNCSAPHGAGRILSRTEAKKLLSLEDFQEQMKGIYSSSISLNTIDECPMAYKSMKDIIKYIHETVDIVKIMKPVYNFKA